MTKVTSAKFLRSSLSEDYFAVPGKKKLPINDERHTRLSWDMLEKTKGLTAAEKKQARERILARAEDLGLDISDWDKVKALGIECMSLDISTADHPNKMPFTGVLTKIDEPSDAAPSGSMGRRVIVTADAAKRALASLLGMAVDFTPSFDGHDARTKIGIITSADIVGNELRISGFVYAADFPDIAELIQDLKHVLGFSFEAQRIRCEDYSADVLRIIELTFTGAAILKKDKAAYTTTSLAASAEGELDMTPEELKALMGPLLTEALKPISDRLTVVEAANKTVVDNLNAQAALRAKVEPHAVALETAATAMEASGIDASHLRKQAETLRSEAAAGRMPKTIAASTTVTNNQGPDVEGQIKAAVEAAVKPLNDKLAETETKLKDVQATARTGSQQPERKTMPPAISALLTRAGIGLPEGEKKLTVPDVDKLMASANLNMTQRVMVKNQLDRAGFLAS